MKDTVACFRLALASWGSVQPAAEKVPVLNWFNWTQLQFVSPQGPNPALQIKHQTRRAAQEPNIPWSG